ncbi:RAxF-45 family protein [Paenibacillus phoenicis]|uniref:RAxF-45 family protein n=1 Tax=Paenibacillus phoenicis TaxID=554117 RepID=A0ABU5PNE5_9BACL|nr:RAxF-45 family protein [Paenibacillus phoenicis]MEA3571469.1 RAxF-45 family protein [Paenibacillus phoenicis]
MNEYNVRNYFVKEVGRVDRKFAWNRVGQLPVAMFGIIHAAANNGRSLSIFGNSISKPNCEMPLLP